MGFFLVLAFRIFGSVSRDIGKYFSDVKTDLKRAKMGYSLQEYVSMSLLAGLLVLIILLPLLAFLFGIFLQSFLFSFTFSIMTSLTVSVLSFFLILNYPKSVIGSKSKDLDSSLPFATLYLATISGSKLPLHKTLEIFSKFSSYGEINRQVKDINQDIKVFGLDTNTALERAIDRSPSRNFRELLYGILSTLRSGADLSIFLSEKSKNFIAEYRRKLYEFSQSLTVYIEVYLTSMVLGAIFFTILTAVLSGISRSGAGGLIMLQFILVFVFLPVISTVFIIIIKSASPKGE